MPSYLRCLIPASIHSLTMTYLQYIGAYLSYNINQSGAFIIAAGAIRELLINDV